MAANYEAAMLGQAQGITINLSEIAQILRNAFPLSAFQGTFTCSGAATTTVSDTNTKEGSSIFIYPTNAAAAALQGAGTHLYISARTEDTSFAVTTGSGAAAAGTETFLYIIVNVG